MMWIYQDELENNPFNGSFKSLIIPLQNSREKVSSTYLLSAQAFIASVFKIPFEAMDGWDSETFLCRLAQAEFVSGVPLNPVDPTAPQHGLSGGKGKKPKRQLTPAQQKVVDKKYGAGTAEQYNADTVRSQGQVPSKQMERDSETFTYTK
jgi:hypothetical protein